MLRVGFTGTQRGMTEAQLQEVVAHLLAAERTHPDEACELHHGDCVGADVEAARVAAHLGWRTVAHPGPDGPKRAYHESDEVREPKPYMERNDEIAALDALIAAPKEAHEVRRSGTWSTVRRARLRGTPTAVVVPDGRIAYINAPEGAGKEEA